MSSGSLFSCCRTRSSFNILLVSWSFMVLFCSYNMVQEFATSLYPAGLGNESLGVLYVACAISVFAAPGLTNQMGPRFTMVLGAACYVVYLLSLIHIIPWVVLIMSTVIGFGGAILWIALGVFITQNSTKDTYGQNTGIFWSIFQLCNVFGNLATYLFFSQLTNTFWLFVGFAIIGTVGTFMLIFLRKAKNIEEEEQEKLLADQDPNSINVHTVKLTEIMLKDTRPFKERFHDFLQDVMKAFKLIFTKDMALLIPMYFFSGLELAFWSGEFSQMINTNVIGLVLTFTGIGEVIGGIFFGKLSDYAGRSASILTGAVCYATGLGLACYMRYSGWMPAPVFAGAPLVAYIAAFLFGLGDSSFNANCYAICAQLYQDGPQDSTTDEHDEHHHEHDHSPLLHNEHITTLSSTHHIHQQNKKNNKSVEGITNSVGAFTIFQLVQNIGSAVGFFYGLPIPMHDPNPSEGQYGTYIQAYIQYATLVVATIMFVTVDRIHAREGRAGAK